MVPLEKYFNGIFGFGIFPIGIAFPSRHWCNWLERFARISILVGIKCALNENLAPKSFLV
jgi:hypothetical protein